MPLLNSLMVFDAVKEMTAKSNLDIEKETAIKWAARYLAALQMHDPRHNPESYRHEALEHAALHSPGLLSMLADEIGREQEPD